MFAIRFTTARETLVSVAGTLLFSSMLVAAAVMPAQVAVAATFGL